MTVLLCHPCPALMPSAFCLLPPKTAVLLPEFWCLSKALKGLSPITAPSHVLCPSHLDSLYVFHICLSMGLPCGQSSFLFLTLLPSQKELSLSALCLELSTHCLGGSAPPCKCGNPVDEALVLSWFLLLLFLSAWLLGAQPQLMRCLCLLKKSAFCVCM